MKQAKVVSQSLWKKCERKTLDLQLLKFQLLLRLEFKVSVVTKAEVITVPGVTRAEVIKVQVVKLQKNSVRRNCNF